MAIIYIWVIIQFNVKKKSMISPILFILELSRCKAEIRSIILDFQPIYVKKMKSHDKLMNKLLNIGVNSLHVR